MFEDNRHRVLESCEKFFLSMSTGESSKYHNFSGRRVSLTRAKWYLMISQTAIYSFAFSLCARLWVQRGLWVHNVCNFNGVWWLQWNLSGSFCAVFIVFRFYRCFWRSKKCTEKAILALSGWRQKQETQWRNSSLNKRYESSFFSHPKDARTVLISFRVFVLFFRAIGKAPNE